MATSRQCVVARAAPGKNEVCSGGSSSSLHPSRRIFEEFHVGGAIKSTRTIVYNPTRSSDTAADMADGHPRQLNRSMTGPALVTSVVSAVHTVTRRLEFTRSHSRTLACTRSTSAHPTVSVTCSKAAPIRVLSLAHSIPETEGDERKEEKDTLFKKRSRSASFIESRRADTPRQLLAFMFSGTTKFANDSKWTCAAGIHRILNLTGVPISPAANCQCREESLQKKHRKQELILNIDYRTSPKKIAASFTQVNSFIARARSAASNILVCHRPDHVEYCMAFVVQYIIVYHDIPLNRALGHCRALQNFDIPLNAIEALKIWEKTKSYPPETLNQVTPLPATRSDDFKWVEVRRPVKLAWC